MHRCLELASLAAGYTAPNPMVGAVLVHNDVIIGEGYHKVYGGPHAEVNCIDSVPPERQHLIKDADMYVSLEPCAHHGKTPPCADLIIRHNIRKVYIGCRDPFAEVDGRGIGKLQSAGVETFTGILENECQQLNKRFFTFHTQKRPYVVLKWAQTADGMIGLEGKERLHITGDVANRFVHKWRSEEASIMVGTNTAQKDDPQLTNRLWSGRSPTRIVIDLDLRLPKSLHLFDGSTATLVFNSKKHGRDNNIDYYQIERGSGIIHRVLHALHELNLTSVFIEGGAQLLQSFIDEGRWDEARVIINNKLTVPAGIRAPVFKGAVLVSEQLVENDLIKYYIRK